MGDSMTITINGTTGISGVDGSSGTPAYQGNDANTGISFGTDIVTINTGGTARVTTDASGNVGIGTSSPAARLDVRGSTAVVANFIGNNANNYIQLSDNNGTNLVSVGSISGGNFYTFTAGYNAFYTGSAEKMRLTSGGDVGIGTISPNQKLQVTGSNSTGFAGATLQNSNANVGLAGVQFSSDTTYSKSAIAQVRENANGNGPLVFYVDSATDAADWASGDEKMRISAAGNVGIGTATTTYRTNIVYTNSAGGVAETGLYLRNTSTGNSTQMLFDGHRSYSLLVQGSFGAPAGGFTIQDNTAGVDRLNIDSSGNVLVGTTSGADFKLRVNRSGNLGICTLTNSDTSGLSYDQFQIIVGQSASSAYMLARWYVAAGASPQFAFRGDGQMFATTTSIASISDARVKENVRNADDGLQTILGLRTVRFDFKEGFGNNKKNQLGFIAQEVETVFPDAVDVAGVTTEDVDAHKSVAPGTLIPVLVKAIQELTARLEVLENK
jgi:hypothetical protein